MKSFILFTASTISICFMSQVHASSETPQEKLTRLNAELAACKHSAKMVVKGELIKETVAYLYLLKKDLIKWGAENANAVPGKTEPTEGERQKILAELDFYGKQLVDVESQSELDILFNRKYREFVYRAFQAYCSAEFAAFANMEKFLRQQKFKLSEKQINPEITAHPMAPVRSKSGSTK